MSPSPRSRHVRCATALAAAAALLAGAEMSAAAVRASYLYSLSDFTGTVPFTWVRVVADEGRNEVYVAEAGAVFVFNEAGMQLYRFGDDDRLGRVHDVAPLPGGDLLLLGDGGDQGEASLIRCDYRGEFQERLLLTGLGQGAGAFRPTRMVLRGGTLYLADLAGMRVAVADTAGAVREEVDLAARLHLSGQQVADSGLGGFDADRNGTLYFTLPTRFQAFRLPRGGEPQPFGQPGSSPGKFGVVAGIAADASGTLYVVDTLKCVVIAFGPDLEFLAEFGFRSWRQPEGLIAPKEATVAGDGRVYVTQQGRRGVNVYRLSVN